MIERVRIVENFQTLGHQVVVAGRPHPGAPMHYMTPTGEWVRISEGAMLPSDIGFKLPEGALDAIMREYLKVAAPNEATGQHLADAVAVRDRLLAMLEKRGIR